MRSKRVSPYVARESSPVKGVNETGASESMASGVAQFPLRFRLFHTRSLRVVVAGGSFKDVVGGAVASSSGVVVYEIS